MSALLAALMAAADPSAIAVAAQPVAASDAAPADSGAAAPHVGEDIVVTGARTEGSQDYTIPGQTTATRMNLSLRDTPQSVSVVTRAQIEDFQLNDVNTLLCTVPGINVQAGETDRVYFSARGFDIQTFQIDGIGVPFAFGIQTGSIDTAFYDHIEVVRGAPGLLSSTGNPSAVVNFIRKRPTRDLQVGASAQYGSFDQYRGELDVSVPMTRDGSIRARGVGAYQDGDSYLDRYGLRRWVGYGIVEADLGANTVVSGGYGYQNHKSRGAMWGAIPLTYSDGTPLNFDRSSNVAPSWSSWNVIDRQIFGDLTHKFDNGWIARFSAIRRATDENDKLFYVYGNPSRTAPNGIDIRDPADPFDDVAIQSYPGAFRGPTRNLTMEAYVTGPVTIGGREHEINIGVNRSAQRYRQYSSYDYSQVGLNLSYPGLFDGNFPEVNFPANYDLSLDQHLTRETAYGLVRLNPGDAVKVMLGGNLTHAKMTGYSYGLATSFDETRFLPFAGVTIDLSRNFSVYGSWTTIFNPQEQLLDINNRPLGPIDGENLEAGLKGEWFGGRLNATLAVFRTRQDNTGEQRTRPAGETPVGGLPTYYVGIDAQSEGVELDVGGQLAPGLQVTGGYTLMRIENPEGRPVRRFVARNTGRLNVSYTLPMLPALKLGAAAQYQSRIVSPSGLGRQGDYALLDLLAAYRITPNVTAAVNLRNVTNTKYLTATNFDGGYYGAPRTVMGTISVQY